MTRVTKLASAALIAFTLATGTAYALTPGVEAVTRKVNEYEGQHFALTGDPSQWGSESLAKKGSFDITEVEGSEEPMAPDLARKVNQYEGQHLS